MRRKILLLARRDYVAAVFTKAFLVGLLAPILAIAALSIFSGGMAILFRHGSPPRRVALVDHTGLNSAATVVRMQKQQDAEPYSGRARRSMSDIVFEISSGNDRPALLARVRKGDLFGILDIESTQSASLMTFSGAGGLAYADIYNELDRGMREVKLRQSDLDPARFADVLKPVPIELKGIDKHTESLTQSMNRSVLIPVVVTLLMLFTVVTASLGMLGGVAEDKKERVFEMMLASVTPLEIMAGKVIGSVAVALTSSAAWILYTLLGLVLTRTIRLAPLHLLPWFFLYLTCQLMMLGAIGAAIGAAAASPAAAQRFSTVLLAPVTLPVLVLFPLLDQPNASWAVVLSLVPPVAPMVMLVRQAMPTGVPFWQPWLALVITLSFTCLLTWIASRIFRVALLAQGAQPSWTDLARWALR